MVLLNAREPKDDRTVAISADIASRYGVTCMPVNCQTLSEEDVAEIIKGVLYEFPVKEVDLFLPSWVGCAALQSPHQGKSLHCHPGEQSANAPAQGGAPCH